MRESTSKLVWYVCYGSNLQYKRFMCYIQGGLPPGRTERNGDCRCHNAPLDSRTISLRFDLFFAGRSKPWGNGGWAFIRENPEREATLGRMYLITDEQFNDLVMQENSRRIDGSRLVPEFEQLVTRRESILPGNLRYGRLVNIGSEGTYPILTFTAAQTDLELNAPSEEYAKTIASGIKETYPAMSNEEIVAYLMRSAGLGGRVDLTTIQRWVDDA